MSKVFKSININQQEKKIISHGDNSTNVNEAFLESNVENNVTANSSNEKILEEAEEQANKLIQQAEELINKQKADSEHEIEQWWKTRRNDDKKVIEKSREQGYQEGYSKGLDLAKKELQEEYTRLIEQAKQALTEAYQIKESIIQEAEPQILELSLDLAKKIIIKELELNPDIIKEITKEALSNIREIEKIAINVHPNDFAYLQSAREELLMELNGQVELTIFPDPTIKDGGCIIKTTNGTLDATIDTQLKELRQILYETLGRGL